MIVSIIAQGAMGAGTAARLAEHGALVRTDLAGRSAASARRAAAAGMRPVGIGELVAADVVLSIVPPAEAVPLAERLAPHLAAAERKPVYVDFNAVSPATACRIAGIVEAAGAPFLDGGIIGGPPQPGAPGPAYYVCGAETGRLAELGRLGLRLKPLDGPVGTASALKLSYAGINKGLTGIAAAMILAAERADVAGALHAELADSQPALLAGLEQSVRRMFDKAGRWVAEMEEIAAFSGSDRAESEVYAGLAGLFARLAADRAGGGTEIRILDGFFPDRAAD